jgi:hypothetical protein
VVVAERPDDAERRPQAAGGYSRIMDRVYPSVAQGGGETE